MSVASRSPFQCPDRVAMVLPAAWRSGRARVTAAARAGAD